MHLYPVNILKQLSKFMGRIYLVFVATLPFIPGYQPSRKTHKTIPFTMSSVGEPGEAYLPYRLNRISLIVTGTTLNQNLFWTFVAMKPSA